MRADEAVQQKLDALADGLADLMEALAYDKSNRLRGDLIELRAAVGLELWERLAGRWPTALSSGGTAAGARPSRLCLRAER